MPLAAALEQAHENIKINKADVGPDADGLYPPRSAPNQASQGESGFVDSSGPIYSMYMEMAEEEDKKLAESWKADAEGILVFTGLFSAAVASLISVSIQDIRQNPQDTSNFYLANIYAATINDSNRSNNSSSFPASPPAFSPPAYAVWVNSLWFLSLAISITCALLATLLQQWARRYLKVTQTRASLHKRARIRSFFAEGVDMNHLSMVVEGLPTLIHVSVSLFFAGLAVFLWNVNLTILTVVLSWIGVCATLYGCITLIPIFRHNSPYYSPLTPLARPVVIVILYAFVLLYLGFYVLVFVCSSCFSCRGLVRIFGPLGDWIGQVLDTITMTPEKAALKSSSAIDTRALIWTFDRLDEDHELERFFSGLPGFHNSKVVKEPLRGLDDQQKLGLLEAVIRLLDRTFSSNLLSDQVKRQRADICANAIDLVDTPNTFSNLVHELVSEDEYGPAQSTAILDFVRRWDNRKDEDTTLVQAMFSIVVARVQRRDDSWFKLASNDLGIPETVLREYSTQGDSLSLAMLIYVTRQQFTHIRNPSWPSQSIAGVLKVASKFNVQDTSPELQHEFCALWNQIARDPDAPNRTSKIPEEVLGPIRNPYIALHQNTDSAPTLFSPSSGDDDINLLQLSSYPVCNVTGHVPNRSSSTTSPLTVPHDDAALSPAPAFPLPALLHVDESLTTVPLDNSHPARQTTENFRVPVTSPDQVAASAMRETVALGITTPLPTPEISKSTSPLLSTSPPASVSPQHDPNPLVSSCQLNFPSSASSNPALDNILHTATATAAPGDSPGLTSATYRGSTPEEHGSPMPGLPEGKDVLHPPAVNRSTLDPQVPSPPSVTDSDQAVVASCSPREPIAGRIGGDHPPHVSHCSYDIV